MAYSGTYFPKNPTKYTGNVNNIIYRSLWERKFFVWCDENPDILEWCSEEIVIPYRSPLDRNIHRYFPDVFVKAKKADGTISSQLIEIKPEKETIEPVKGTKKTKKYIREVTKYLVNQAKWKAAKEVCKDRGWDFVLITEKHLFPNQSK